MARIVIFSRDIEQMKRFYTILCVVVMAAGLILSAMSAAYAESPLTPDQVRAYKQAKAGGKLVERANGYLAAGSGAGSALLSLMEKVNRLRKEKYRAIADNNNVPIQAVEMSAGKRLTGR